VTKNEAAQTIIGQSISLKRTAPDQDGVRIAELDEMSYRQFLWTHQRSRIFGASVKATATKLEANGIYTMGDLARCSLGKPQEHHNEDLLYKLFGINAELLIDHA